MPGQDAWLVRAELRKEKRDKNHAEHLERLRQKEAGKRAVRGLQAHLKAPAPATERNRTMEMPDPRLLPDHELAAWIKALVHVDRYDWRGTARPEQIEPDDYKIWLLMAGRGFGKTRCSAEAVREQCATPMSRVAVIAKDHRALRDVCFEGNSGLISCIPPSEIKEYRKGLGDVSILMTNGSVIKGYTAGEPDAIRGQAFDMIWGDEFAAWPANKASDMLTQARMCLRESPRARAILSTTPKRIKHVVDMIKLANDPEERIIVTGGRSRDNIHLSEDWHRQMERDYGGTAMGRQELDGELVMDNEHALWKSSWIDSARWAPTYDEKHDSYGDFPRMMGVVVGVDPSGSKDGDATGISTIGWDADKALYVLDNRTCNGEPFERYTAVCMTVIEFGASEIVYETAYGGDNAKFGIEQTWKALQDQGVIPADHRCPPIVGSKVKGDKAGRAMPIAALYEQQYNKPERRRIFHVTPTEANQLAMLEEEQLTWETNSTKSPNAIDAMVHACHRVLVKTGQWGSMSAPGAPTPDGRPNFTTRRLGGRGYNPFG